VNGVLASDSRDRQGLVRLERSAHPKPRDLSHYQIKTADDLLAILA